MTGKYRKRINSTYSKRPRKRKKSTVSLKPLKILFFLAVIILVVGGIGAFSVVYSLVKETPSLKNLEIIQPEVTSYVYDRYGNEQVRLFEEQNRIEIKLEDIPLITQRAFIAIEDERFYDHIGFDTRGILRAIWALLRKQSLEGPGGSTITQQLVRDAFLTKEKTIERKIKEIWLAIKMEQQYTKEEILEMYLNRIYFAHGAYGLEAAAQTYFNKNAANLTLAESALLAGILPAPNLYSPFVNIDLAKERQSIVLNKMVELGYISAEEAAKAKSEELSFGEPPSREYPFPYFMDYLLHHELINILTASGLYDSREEAYDAVYTQGLKIYSTLGPSAQKIVEDIINNPGNYPHTDRVDMQSLRKLMETTSLSRYPQEVLTENGIPQPQAAAVVANPVTGEILALVGGREYSKDNQDLRFLSRRQPGSAIKPVVSYAPALEENLITPGSILDDSPFAQGNWAPENFDRRFRGLTTVRESIVWSYNVPAVRNFLQLTPAIGLEYAQQMGLSTIHQNDYNLASALGGLTYGVTALDMSQAYGVFANQGIKVKYHTITKIEDRNGRVIYQHRGEPKAVLSPQTAYLVTDMLKDVARRGTASRLNIGRPVAAKTGTTSDNRDAYLVAYTPDLVVSFWMGHDIPKLGRVSGGSSSTITFVNQIMKGILENEEEYPVRDFERPPGISPPISICNKSGLRPGPHCPSEHIVSEIFPVNLVPQETCNLHVEIEICSESGLLPGDFCPEETREKKVFLDRPEFISTDHRWAGGAGRIPEDAKLMPPQAQCDIHTQRIDGPRRFSVMLEEHPLRVHLTWETYRTDHPGMPDEDESAISELVLLRKENGEEEFKTLAVMRPHETYFVDVNIAANKTYTYRLIAISRDGSTSAQAELVLHVPDIPEHSGNKGTLKEEEMPKKPEDSDNSIEKNEGEPWEEKQRVDPG